MRIRLSGVLQESIVDGPGLRATVFVQGCPHYCEGCHNAHTHPFEGGYEDDTEKVAADILANPLNLGVTFSGGEPLCQAAPLVDLARRLGKHLVIYTGYTFEELIAESDPNRMALLALCDILIDGKFVLAERDLTLRFRGSRNQRILDCKASLKEGRAVEIQ